MEKGNIFAKTEKNGREEKGRAYLAKKNIWPERKNKETFCRAASEKSLPPFFTPRGVANLVTVGPNDKN